MYGATGSDTLAMKKGENDFLDRTQMSSLRWKDNLEDEDKGNKYKIILATLIWRDCRAYIKTRRRQKCIEKKYNTETHGEWKEKSWSDPE